MEHGALRSPNPTLTPGRAKVRQRKRDLAGNASGTMTKTGDLSDADHLIASRVFIAFLSYCLSTALLVTATLSLPLSSEPDIGVLRLQWHSRHLVRGRSPSLFSHRLGGVLELKMSHTGFCEAHQSQPVQHRVYLGRIVGTFASTGLCGWREGFRQCAESQRNAKFAGEWKSESKATQSGALGGCVMSYMMLVVILY